MASELGGSFPGVGDGFGEGIVPTFLRRGRVPESSVRPGSVGQRLVSDAVDGSLGAKWSDAVSPYYAAMYLSTAETHNTGAGFWMDVGANTGVWTSLWDVRPQGVSAQVDTANYRLIARKAGVYHVIGKVTWANIAANKRLICGLFVNGALADYQDFHTSNATDYAMAISSYVYLPLNGALRLGAWQNDSASELIPSSAGVDYWTRLSFAYVGPSS